MEGLGSSSEKISECYIFPVHIFGMFRTLKPPIFQNRDCLEHLPMLLFAWLTLTCPSGLGLDFPFLRKVSLPTLTKGRSPAMCSHSLCSCAVHTWLSFFPIIPWSPPGWAQSFVGLFWSWAECFVYWKCSLNIDIICEIESEKSIYRKTLDL